jgi:hypothetical protein
MGAFIKTDQQQILASRFANPGLGNTKFYAGNR